MAHPPKPHPNRVHHNPSTQKRPAWAVKRWQYGRTEDNLQRAYAVINGGLAAKRIVPNSDKPANTSALYAEELSSPAPSSSVLPHAATGGRRRLTHPDSPSSPHPPPDCAKLAVSHLCILQSSRLFHLPRTFDANRQPTDTTSHTTWVDLLQSTPRGQKEEDCASELEYEIKSIISHRGKRTNTQYKVRWVGYTEKADEWLPRASLKGPRLDESTNTKETETDPTPKQ
jgi:hypothetical protein